MALVFRARRIIDKIRADLCLVLNASFSYPNIAKGTTDLRVECS